MRYVSRFGGGSARCRALLPYCCINAKTPFVTVHMGDNGGLTHAEAVAFAAPHGVTVGYDGLELTV